MTFKINENVKWIHSKNTLTNERTNWEYANTEILSSWKMLIYRYIFWIFYVSPAIKWEIKMMIYFRMSFFLNKIKRNTFICIIISSMILWMNLSEFIHGNDYTFLRTLKKLAYKRRRSNANWRKFQHQVVYENSLTKNQNKLLFFIS